MPRWVDIHEHEVHAFIEPGGEVNDILSKLAREGAMHAGWYLARGKYGSRNGSHNRSGRLTRGIYNNRAKVTGPLTGFSRIGSRAKHTEYFMYGTTGPITGKGPYGYLLVPRQTVGQRSPGSKGAGSELYAAWNARGRKGRKGFFQAQKVSGQRAKPFLEDAKDEAMHLNGFFPR